MREFLKRALRSWDLLAIIALGLVLALFIYLIPDNLARLALGLPFILFFPGHALVSALFPEKLSLDTIERVALAIGLSVAIVPLIGFGLNYTPFGIRLEPILWSLIAFNTVAGILGLWRRGRAANPYLPADLMALWSSARKSFGKGSSLDRALTIILILAVLSSVGAMAYVVAVPREGEHFTEFYILGPGGSASDYPTNLTVGETGQLIVGIANHEYRTINYTVEVWLANTTFSDNTTTVNRLYFMESFNVTLDHVDAVTDGNWTAQWETTYNFTAPFAGQYKLWFILLLDGEPYSGPALTDVATTEAGTRFINIVDNSDSYVLNLNMRIT